MLRQLQAQIVFLQAQLAALSRPPTTAELPSTAEHNTPEQVRYMHGFIVWSAPAGFIPWGPIRRRQGCCTGFMTHEELLDTNVQSCDVHRKAQKCASTNVFCLHEFDVTASRIELASASSLASSAATDEVPAAKQPPGEVPEQVKDVDSERGSEASASASAPAPASASASASPRAAPPVGDADGGSAPQAPMAAALMPPTVSAPGDDTVDSYAAQQTRSVCDRMQPTASPGPQALPAHEEQTHSEDRRHAATHHAEEREAWIAAAAADAMTPEEQERVALERQLRSIQGKVGAARHIQCPGSLKGLSQLHWDVESCYGRDHADECGAYGLASQLAASAAGMLSCTRP